VKRFHPTFLPMSRPLSALFFLSTVFSPCQEAPKPTPGRPKIVRLDDHRIQIGKIIIDQEKRQLSFQAGVNMTEGLIEYCLATTKSDKVHETLFLTDISPFNLNIGMKLLGIKESKELFEIIDQETWTPTGKFPEVTPEVHAASLVDLIVEWGEGDKKTRRPMNELIHHIDWPEEAETPQPNQKVETQEATLSVMEPGPWLSTGSYLHEGRLKAEVGGLIFAIFTNEQAIVNFSGKDRQLGDVWIPHQKNVPKVGTVVTLIVKPHQPK
jgi:hypothetical protein